MNALEQVIRAMISEEVEAAIRGIRDSFPLAIDRTLDVQEAADYIGISKELLYRMCAERRIPHVRLGIEGTRKPKLLFSTQSIDRWKREQEQLNYRIQARS